MSTDYNLEKIAKLEEDYSESYDVYSKNFDGKSMRKLLEGVKEEDNIVELKEYILAICQLVSYEAVDLSGEACPLYQRESQKKINEYKPLKIFATAINFGTGFKEYITTNPQ